MVACLSQSPEETRAFAATLSQWLQPGDVLMMHGDLGAGKSEFTRGLAHGLGITSPVSSPSFTIMNLYDEGRLPLYHFDWYRLNSAEELFEMGMEEYLGGEGIAVVEWPSQCPEAIPTCHLSVTLMPVDESTRRIVLEPQGGFRSLETLPKPCKEETP